MGNSARYLILRREDAAGVETAQLARAQATRKSYGQDCSRSLEGRRQSTLFDQLWREALNHLNDAVPLSIRNEPWQFLIRTSPSVPCAAREV